MTNLFQGIPEESIEIILKNIEKNLEKISLYDGHTIKKHVDIQLRVLKTRVEMEDIKYATSFYDFDIARTVAIGLLKGLYQSKVKEWLLSPFSDYLTLKGTYKKAVGYGFRKNDETLYKGLRKVCLVLAKESDSSWGFRIVTLYPQFD